MKTFLYETAVVAVAALAVVWFRLTRRPERAADVWADAMAELDEGIDAQLRAGR